MFVFEKVIFIQTKHLFIRVSRGLELFGLILVMIIAKNPVIGPWADFGFTVDI